MVHDQVDIPLCQELKRSLFGQYHTQHRMYIFHTRLLAAAHGITVIDACPDNALNAVFQRVRVPKLCPAVCQYGPEDREKSIGIQPLFEPVKHQAYSPGRIAVHHKCEEQFFFPE